MASMNPIWKARSLRKRNWNSAKRQLLFYHFAGAGPALPEGDDFPHTLNAVDHVSVNIAQLMPAAPLPAALTGAGRRMG